MVECICEHCGIAFEVKSVSKRRRFHELACWYAFQRAMHWPKALQVLSFITGYKIAHDGNSPTIREIQKATGLYSPSRVPVFLAWLEEKGKIRNLAERRAAPLRIEVIGGRWVPPENYVEVKYDNSD